VRLRARLDEGHTVIFLHPIFVYKENPYSDRKCQCDMTGAALI
jgi:hypothetical protein